MDSTQRKKAIVFGLVIVGTMAPVVLASLFGHAQWSAPWVYGAISALVATLISTRLALVLSVTAGVAICLGMLLSPYPLPGAIYLGLLTFGSAITARQGLHSAVLMIPLFTSFALASPTELDLQVSSVANALIVGAIAILGGLWTIGVKHAVLGKRALPRTTKNLSQRAVATYAIAMGLVVGISTWAILTWAPSHQGAWMIMTIIVLMQPSPHDTTVKSLQRVAGTIVGVAIAGLISTFVHSDTLSLILAVVLLFAAVLVYFVLDRPYWQFVTLLTPAVVMVDSIGSDVDAMAQDRIVFTLLGAAVALGCAIIAKFVIDQWFSKDPETSAA